MPEKTSNVAEASGHETSHLFTLRIWHERLGNGQMEWRGQIRHILTGQVRYFRGWSALAEHLEALSQAMDAGGEPGLLKPAEPHTPASTDEA